MSSSLVLDLSRYCAGSVPVIGEARITLDPTGRPWVQAVPVLAEELARVPDPRRAAGRRHDLVFLLGIVVMAVLAGAMSLAGIRRWATGVDPAVLTGLARGGPITVPVVSTLSRLLARLDGDAVDDAFARYIAAVLAPGDPDPFPQNLFEQPGDTTESTGPTDTADAPESAGPTQSADAAEAAGTGEDGDRVAAGAALRVASLDGKCVRGAVTATSKTPYLVSVFRHDTKTVAAQRQVDVKSNEITAFQAVFDVLPDLTGHVVVTDALHTQREHARYLHGRMAFHLFPVAENQPKLFTAVNAMPWETTPVGYAEEGKAHGRHELRTTKVLPAPPGLPFPHVKQVILTERITTGRGDDKTHAVAALAVTAVPARLAGPADLARMIRGHWGNHFTMSVMSPIERVLRESGPAAPHGSWPQPATKPSTWPGSPAGPTPPKPPTTTATTLPTPSNYSVSPCENAKALGRKPAGAPLPPPAHPPGRPRTRSRRAARESWSGRGSRPVPT